MSLQITIRLNIIMLVVITKLWEGNVFTPVCHSVHRGGGGSLFKGPPSKSIDVQGVCPGGLCPRGFSVQRGGGLCPRGISVTEILRMVMCGQYASYWNAF